MLKQSGVLTIVLTIVFVGADINWALSRDAEPRKLADFDACVKL